MIQEPTCTHAHEYRLLGASCFIFIFCVTFVHPNLCQPANFYNYAGIELVISESAVQYLIHWATDARPYYKIAKIAILVNLVSRLPYVFNMAAFLKTMRVRCLRPVSCYISHANATATRGAATKRPLKNLELCNYPLRQNENIHDTKTSQEPVTLRSLQSSSEFGKMF